MNKHDRKKSSISRRGFIEGAGAITALTALQPFTRYMPTAQAVSSAGLFSLGVASGDPSPISVMLWTRLAPHPLEDGGGMPARPVLVRWEIAEDERMRRVVRSGVTLALPENAHNVHVFAVGLAPDRWYYYRFAAQGEVSRVGRTRTFPEPFARSACMRFALASCQDYQNGLYSAFHNMAEEDLDFVVHVGDYIYEYGPSEGGPRQVPDGEIVTLSDYRRRYALYRLDPKLQEVHARFPMIVTWDDHEVDNNYAGEVPEDDQTHEAFLARRSAAYQAYFEAMPLLPSARPRGTQMRLYRQFQFGTLADLNVLDSRQFRSDQPCGDGFTYCPDVTSDQATMLGAAQMDWLEGNLRRSRAKWNVLAQQVMLTKWDGAVLTGFQSPLFNVDAWDGYQAARQRLLGFIAERNIANPVVLSGDIHSSWVADLLASFDDPTSRVVASEFVGTSITSDFPVELIPVVEATLPFNPHIKFFDALHRGYVTMDVTPSLWTASFRGVESILDAEAPATTLATFVIEDGTPGVQMG